MDEVAFLRNLTDGIAAQFDIPAGMVTTTYERSNVEDDEGAYGYRTTHWLGFTVINFADTAEHAIEQGCEWIAEFLASGLSVEDYTAKIEEDERRALEQFSNDLLAAEDEAAALRAAFTEELGESAAHYFLGGC